MPAAVPIITSLGLVTPLGDTAAATWDALLAGRYIIDHAKLKLQTPAGVPRVSSLAIRAAREATQNVNATLLRDAAIVVGTSKGPVEEWLNRPSTLSDLEGRFTLEAGEFGLSRVACDVARALGIDGPRITVCTACASGLHALIRAAMMIRAGEASRVLVVAAEASVHPLFIASFERLGILAPAGVGCRPFDRGRAGFVMSDAAAAVWLEAGTPGASGIAVEHFAMGADATHLTGTSDEAEPLRRTLLRAWPADGVDLVHAHGTGTIQNDATELAVLERIVAAAPARAPNVYSHKGALGHSLGAAGLVSVVLNILSHRTGIVPPSPQQRNPLPTTNLRLSTEAVRRPVRRSVAVAAGFGGQIAAVSLA